MPIRGYVTPLVAATPPRISLVSSAILDPRAASDERWVAGFSYLPNGCNDGELLGAQCAVDISKDLEDPPAIVEYVPHAVIASARCSTLGLSGEDPEVYGARALTILEAVTPKQLEAELWRGDRAQADSLPNNYLANAASLENLSPGGSDVSPGAYALAALQEYLADCHDGGRGMIHAPRSVVTIWQVLGVVRREPGSNVLLDLYDNIVVPGVGYDGSDPDGNVDASGETAWAYATSMVEVKLGRAELLPGVGQIAAAIDRSTNDAEWRAERPVAATWDGCCHAGIRVGVCATCCTPEG
jgi:hypothetical protein